MRIYIFLALLFYSLTSCNSNPEAGFNPDKIFDVNQYDSIVLSDIGVKYPIEIAMYDDRRIVLLDDDNKAMIKILDLDSGKIVNSFGVKGRGPREFSEIGSVYIGTKGELLVNDISSRVVARFDTPLQQDAGYKKLWEEKRDIVSLISVEDMIVGCAVFDSVAIYLMDYDARVVDRYYKFPTKPDNANPLTHSMAAIGRVASNGTTPYFARSTFFYGGIDFFALERNKIVEKWNFKQFDMEYDVMEELSGIPTPNKTSRNGYGNLFMSERYLYAPYSGKLIQQENSDFYSTIQVFDFSGEHICQINLPFKAYQVVVDSSDKKGYAIYLGEDGEMYLASFEFSF